MKKTLALFLCTALSTISTAWADIDVAPLLNKVTLQLQSEQWVTTKTALVSVSVNAALADQDVGSLQASVLNKLKSLSNKDEWHIVSFNRQEDQSGLENVRIFAMARLPQGELSGLRDKAKSISKPGETFTIDNVQFTPSDDELRQAHVSLRNNIYQQAKSEIDALNKEYPDQKYYLYSIDFGGNISPMPMAAMYMEKAASIGGANRPAAPPISIGNKVQMQATVVIASMPEVVVQKLSQ